MDKYGVQINKTSINSVLFIATIGVTWSSVAFLLDVLKRGEARGAIETTHRVQQNCGQVFRRWRSSSAAFRPTASYAAL